MSVRERRKFAFMKKVEKEEEVPGELFSPSPSVLKPRSKFHVKVSTIQPHEPEGKYGKNAQGVWSAFKKIVSARVSRSFQCN